MMALLQRDLILAIRAGGGFGLGMAFFFFDGSSSGPTRHRARHGNTCKSFSWYFVGGSTASVCALT